MLKHHVFLIHGITDRVDNNKDFKELCERIRRQFRAKHKQDPDEYLEFVPIEWDSAVGDAEKGIYERSFGKIRPADRLLVSSIISPLENVATIAEAVGHLGANSREVLTSRWNKWREWRYFSTLFVGDVIAYVDENDNGLRRSVWKVLKQHLVDKSNEVPEFSIIGHSLGSVIAFDFLFALLTANGPQLFNFGSGEGPHERVEAKKLQQIKDAFRNFYTLGSPLSLFLMRKKQLWGVNGEATFEAVKNPFHGTTNRWINFLDTDDVVAYPVEPFFNGHAELGQRPNPIDVYVQAGWLPLPAHSHIGYWKNDEVAKQIAQTLPVTVRKKERELAGAAC